MAADRQLLNDLRRLDELEARAVIPAVSMEVEQEDASPLSLAPDDGFFARTGEALAGRGRKISESIERAEPLLNIPFISEEQGIPETAGQIAGQGLLGAGDVVGNLAMEALNVLPLEGVGRASEAVGLGKLGEAIGQTDVAQSAGDVLGNIMGKYSEFAEKDPRSAANLEALLGIGTAATPIKGFGALEKAAKATGKAVSEAGTIVKNIIPKAKDVTADALKKEASKAFNLADELGGTIKPEVTNNLATVISKKISQEGASLPVGTQAALRSVADPENVIRQASEVFESLRGKPLTLEGFRTIDQTLGDLAYKAGTPDDVSRKVLIMQRSLRDAVEDAKPSDLVGGAKGFNTYKSAKELWSKQSRIRDLENITKKAFATDQPANSLKRALKRFIADDKNIRGFNKTEIDLIKKTADTGIVGEMLRGISGRLAGRIALGTGDVALAPALIAASSGARTLSDDMILRKMQGLSKLIANGSNPQASMLQRTLGGVGGALEATGGAIPTAFKGAKGRLGTLGIAQQGLDRQQ